MERARHELCYTVCIPTHMYVLDVEAHTLDVPLERGGRKRNGASARRGPTEILADAARHSSFAPLCLILLGA